MAGRGIVTDKWPQKAPVLVKGAGYEYRAITAPDRLCPIEEPFGADENNHGESDLPVNFGGVTFFPEDYIYADLTGIILSQEALDLEDFEE